MPYVGLATGGGFATRKLYSDDEEVTFHVTRPIILSSVEDVVIRGDLLDRSVLLQPQRLSPTQVKEEKQLWREFEDMRPRLLGAVLDAVSAALWNWDTVTLPERPRMADFAVWSCAAAPALGWTAAQFLDAYTRNIQSASDLVLEVSPMAQAVLKLLEQQGSWEGTATQLLSGLTPWLEGIPASERPRSAQTLSNALRRIAPTLSKVGVEVIFDQRKNGGNRDRLISICLQPTQVSPAPQTIVPHEPCPIVTPLVESFLATCTESQQPESPRRRSA